ncbi:MAG: phage tail protein [Proteobacteria bacterium]|nr:phage tail protein [Pseudomonadota bacterium]
MSDQRSYTAGRFAFGVDGTFAGFIKKVSGGTIKADVATHDLGTSYYQKKNLATIQHDPLTVEISMGMGKPMWDWIKASFDKGFVQKNCELYAADFNHKIRAIRILNDAYIEEVAIPTCDGASKEAGYFTVKINPNTIRYERGDGSEILGVEDAGAKKWLCSNFRFELGNLPCDRVAKIESFKWTQKIIEGRVGAQREAVKEPAALEVDNLKVTFSMADIEPWAEWHKSFVIDGKCTDSDELTGSLTFLGPDLEEELASISLKHVGIISLEQGAVEANKEEIARATVELYVEEVAFDSYA